MNNMLSLKALKLEFAKIVVADLFKRCITHKVSFKKKEGSKNNKQ